MIKDMIARAQNLLILSFLMPFVYGCNGGGGGDSTQLSSLFSSSSTGDAASSVTSTVAGADVATMVNPEPASLLLLGTGIAAFGLMKRKMNK